VIDLKFKTDGLKLAERYFSSLAERAETAVPRALRKVGYKYSRILKREIATGTPGGERLRPLTIVRQRYLREETGKSRRTPFSMLARFQNYDVEGNRLTIGTLDRGTFAAPSSWLAFARASAEGRTFRVTPGIREHFGRYGRPRRPGEKAYTLRKETTMLTLPARPAIAPFARKYGNGMSRDFETACWAYMDGKKGSEVRI